MIDKDAYLKLRENNLDDQAKLKKNERKKELYIFCKSKETH